MRFYVISHPINSPVAPVILSEGQAKQRRVTNGRVRICTGVKRLTRLLECGEYGILRVISKL